MNLKTEETLLTAEIRELTHRKFETDDEKVLSHLNDEILWRETRLNRVRLELYTLYTAVRGMV